MLQFTGCTHKLLVASVVKRPVIHCAHAFSTRSSYGISYGLGKAADANRLADEEYIAMKNRPKTGTQEDRFEKLVSNSTPRGVHTFSTRSSYGISYGLGKAADANRLADEEYMAMKNRSKNDTQEDKFEKLFSNPTPPGGPVSFSEMIKEKSRGNSRRKQYQNPWDRENEHRKGRLLFPYLKSDSVPQVTQDLPPTRQQLQEEEERRQIVPSQFRVRPKRCPFCNSRGRKNTDKSKQIVYTNVKLLNNFLNDRGMILPGKVTGTCPTHQRKIRKAIINSRQAGFLPFTSKWILQEPYKGLKEVYLSQETRRKEHVRV